MQIRPDLNIRAFRPYEVLRFGPTLAKSLSSPPPTFARPGRLSGAAKLEDTPAEFSLERAFSCLELSLTLLREQQ